MAGNESSGLHAFLEAVMTVKSMTMGGASSGILGSSDPADVPIHDLKRAAVAFAEAYRDPAHDRVALNRLAADIEGHIQAIAAMGIIAGETSDQLIDQLRTLVEALDR